MINRNTFQCLTCGQKTVARTAVGHSDYQEFAFPCPKCQIEIRYGMELHLNKRVRELTAEGISPVDALKQLAGEANFQKLEYVNVKNAVQCDEEVGLPIRTFDGETLNPVSQEEHFSPFMATVWLPKNRERFNQHQQIRRAAADKYWPQIQKLLTHLERKQWDLFDKQLQELETGVKGNSEADRIKAAYHAVESWEKFFAPGTDEAKETVHKRIVLARATSRQLQADLVEFFKAKGRDESINRELFSIRQRWAKFYHFLSVIYLRFYWDDSKNKIESYAVAEKRFEELKPFYVDCFETFCRISAIAAGLEGIIYKKTVGVPLAKRVMGLDEFEGMANGNKRDLLNQLKIADLFAPFIDNKLRNGIGHHSAHFDVVTDSVKYTVENDKGRQDLEMPYIAFCDKVVALYRQLHVVSLYAHWLRKAASGAIDS